MAVTATFAAIAVSSIFSAVGYTYLWNGGEFDDRVYLLCLAAAVCAVPFAGTINILSSRILDWEVDGPGIGPQTAAFVIFNFVSIVFNIIANALLWDNDDTFNYIALILCTESAVAWGVAVNVASAFFLNSIRY